MKKKSENSPGKIDGMIDVSSKKETLRIARARAIIKLKKSIITMIKNGEIVKGDVLEQAKVAGIMAAKKTSGLLPLCHPLRISEVSISFSFIEGGIKIISHVTAFERTGVEMEALIACSTAALTIYDMCKMYDRGNVIQDIMLLEKRGGKSGVYLREEN